MATKCENLKFDYGASHPPGEKTIWKITKAYCDKQGQSAEEILNLTVRANTF